MKTDHITELQAADVLIPVLPLRDVVVYPHMVIPLFVGRERSIDALDAAMRDSKQILLVAQKEAEVDEPDFTDLYQVGTLANILQLLKLPDGTVKVLVEGSERISVVSYQNTGTFYSAIVTSVEEVLGLSEQEQDVLQRTAISSFEQYVKLNNKIPPEVLTSLAGIDDPSRLADTMAAHMSLKVQDKQAILENANIQSRLESLMMLMEGEVDILEMEKKIRV
ncbi:MAG: LON peptidase substrate-binding domain-containing protein, partial [Methylovulum sp.]|nr:LON peptidase substrate-binding domain-containing protein [Methylovulum sp.]